MPYARSSRLVSTHHSAHVFPDRWRSFEHGRGRDICDGGRIEAACEWVETLVIPLKAMASYSWLQHPVASADVSVCARRRRPLWWIKAPSFFQLIRPITMLCRESPDRHQNSTLRSLHNAISEPCCLHDNGQNLFKSSFAGSLQLSSRIPIAAFVT